MPNTHLQHLLFPLVGFLAVETFLIAGQADEQPTASAGISFRQDIQPILATHCYACHGFDAKGRQADLRLDDRKSAVSELPSGMMAIVPGKPEKSELLRRIRLAHTDDERMPPGKAKPLTAEQIKKLEQWIKQGATYEKHWSFEPPSKVALPTDTPASHPIDKFIQHELQKRKLKPSPLAEPTTLIRRASLDLTGLPPTVAEVDQFVADWKSDSASAYEKLIERLLASPHFGERWGRWWLDQARYADSNGYSIDSPRSIWKYRDWVIDALNRDLRFDQFTVEQLAGDLLPNASIEQKIATGFHRNTSINQEGGIDPEQFRIDSIFDRVATTGTVWLGLTVGCAQCHTHKFDPIDHREYYQLFAFFNNQDEIDLKVPNPGIDLAAIEKEYQAVKKKLDRWVADHRSGLDDWLKDSANLAKLDPGLKKLAAKPADKRSADDQRRLHLAGPSKFDQDLLALNQQFDKLTTERAQSVNTMILAERAKPRTTTVFIQGDFTRPADQVTPGVLAVLHPFERSKREDSASGSVPTRLDLAHWLIDSQNPLTARVTVNRIWQQLFGRGIVETENDFGLQGSLPSHPQLLDWLAIEFREKQQWSIKQLVRLIVTSHTYKQASTDRADLAQFDVANIFLARQNRLRLDAEVIRDVALSATGKLTSKIGGPPVYPPVPQGALDTGQVKRNWKPSMGPDRFRRGIYTFQYRTTPLPSSNVFDAPDGQLSCTRRMRSNTPLQALTLMNDPAFVELAFAMEQVVKQHGPEHAFRRCVAREPNDRERAVLASLDPLTAARTLLNLDETITRE